MQKKFNRYSFYAALFLSGAVAIAACGGESDEDIFGEEEDGAAAQTVIDPATVGSIKGAIAFEGTPPAPKAVSMDSDPVCAAAPVGENTSFSSEVSVKDGKLANVFIYISQGINGTFDPPATAAVLDQQGCRYHPHVIGVVVNQPIQFKNSDATLHNVHATPKVNKAFNLAQATKGKVDEKKFDQPEIMIPVSCDVHGWMRSYVGVLTHPFFAVSAEDGSFNIQGVPPGEYTLTAWHETLGTQEQKVTVGQKENKEISFAFKAQ